MTQSSLHDLLYYPGGIYDIIAPKDGERYSSQELAHYLESLTLGIVPSRVEPGIIGLVNVRVARIASFYNKPASEVLGTQICGTVLVCPNSRIPQHVGKHAPR
jgi:hypothetical protein